MKRTAITTAMVLAFAINGFGQSWVAQITGVDDMQKLKSKFN